METTLAWHFTDGMKLRDGQELIVGKTYHHDRVTYHHDGVTAICRSGLQASKKLINALAYAPGATLSRGACSGIINFQEDKLICRERKVLWTIDATEILRKAARKAAIAVLHLWSPPETVCKFLATGQGAAEAYTAVTTARAGAHAVDAVTGAHIVDAVDAIDAVRSAVCAARAAADANTVADIAAAEVHSSAYLAIVYAAEAATDAIASNADYIDVIDASTAYIKMRNRVVVYQNEHLDWLATEKNRQNEYLEWLVGEERKQK